ncbi:MAG: transposase [Ignavibacteriaceae bacterium]
MILNEPGKIVEEIWNNIPKHYKQIELDDRVIMPNHFHGILIINDVETGRAPSLQHTKYTLGNVIGSFKSAVTKEIRNIGFKDFHWRSRFYDHIIRNENDLHQIRKYIEMNPLKWELDEYYSQS